MLKQITRFNQIKLIPNSLIVLDIDETIIKFDKIDKHWWNKTFSSYYSITENHEHAENLCLDDWISHVEIIEPKLVDNNFYDWLDCINKLNCELIFLTARNKKRLENITHLHLDKIKLTFDKNKIYYNSKKGEELLTLVNKKYSDKKNIIVVDDIESNLIDINDKFINSTFNLHLYNIIG